MPDEVVVVAKKALIKNPDCKGNNEYHGQDANVFALIFEILALEKIVILKEIPELFSVVVIS